MTYTFPFPNQNKCFRECLSITIQDFSLDIPFQVLHNLVTMVDYSKTLWASDSGKIIHKISIFPHFSCWNLVHLLVLSLLLTKNKKLELSNDIICNALHKIGGLFHLQTLRHKYDSRVSCRNIIASRRAFKYNLQCSQKQVVRQSLTPPQNAQSQIDSET